MKFWNSKNIDAVGALYNIVIGERGNGKTTEILNKIMENYAKRGEMGVIIRKLDTQISGKRAQGMWNNINAMGWVTKLTDGEYDRVIVRAAQCHFARYNEDTDTVVISPDHFCNYLSLNQAEHNKSIAYPNVTVIMYEEFLSRKIRLTDEFDLFLSTVSTVIRHRKDAKVYLMGNTVTSRSVYFENLNIRNILDMEQGSIATHMRTNKKTGEEFPFAAVEYCAPTEGGKESDIYYNFSDKDEKSMITDGSWDHGQYPKPTKYYTSNDVKANIWFTDGGFNINILGKLIKRKGDVYLFISRQDPAWRPSDMRYKLDVTYSLIPSSSNRVYMDPTISYGNRFTALIAVLFREGRVFFDNNYSGEELADYIHKAQSYSILKI